MQFPLGTRQTLIFGTLHQITPGNFPSVRALTLSDAVFTSKLRWPQGRKGIPFKLRPVSIFRMGSGGLICIKNLS